MEETPTEDSTQKKSSVIEEFKAPGLPEVKEQVSHPGHEGEARAR